MTHAKPNYVYEPKLGTKEMVKHESQNTQKKTSIQLDTRFSVYTQSKKNLERKRGTQYYARDENENVQSGEFVYVSCCWENSPFAQTHSLTVHSRPNTTKSLQQIITLITFELMCAPR